MEPNEQNVTEEVTEEIATEEVATEALAFEAPVAEETASEAPATEEPIIEASVEDEPEAKEPEVEESEAEEPDTEEPADEEPVAEEPDAKSKCDSSKSKKHSHASSGVFVALFVIVAITLFVTIYNVKCPSYTYYNSDGEAVAVVEYAGVDLISTWNCCAADTMAISDEQKTVLEGKGYTLIFNDYAVQISDTKAQLVTGAGSDSEKVYATITTVKDSEGNNVEIETAVQNLAIAVTSGAYTTETNSWIGRFFK